MSVRTVAEVEHTEKMMREARLSERERCAKLIEPTGENHFPKEWSPDRICGHIEALKWAAAAIRNGKQ